MNFVPEVAPYGSLGSPTFDWVQFAFDEMGLASPLRHTVWGGGVLQEVGLRLILHCSYLITCIWNVHKENPSLGISLSRGR